MWYYWSSSRWRFLAHGSWYSGVHDRSQLIAGTTSNKVTNKTVYTRIVGRLRLSGNNLQDHPAAVPGSNEMQSRLRLQLPLNQKKGWFLIWRCIVEDVQPIVCLQLALPCFPPFIGASILKTMLLPFVLSRCICTIVDVLAYTTDLANHGLDQMLLSNMPC
jgi:hypothetical protein